MSKWIDKPKKDGWYWMHHKDDETVDAEAAMVLVSDGFVHVYQIGSVTSKLYDTFCVLGNKKDFIFQKVRGASKRPENYEMYVDYCKKCLKSGAIKVHRKSGFCDKGCTRRKEHDDV